MYQIEKNISIPTKNYSQKKIKPQKQIRRSPLYKGYERRKAIKYIHSLVNQAIKYGKMIKPNQCEVCEKQARLQGHHPDYNRPLDVIWCCRQCHTNIHKYCEVIELKA